MEQGVAGVELLLVDVDALLLCLGKETRLLPGDAFGKQIVLLDRLLVLDHLLDQLAELLHLILPYQLHAPFLFSMLGASDTIPCAVIYKAII